MSVLPRRRSLKRLDLSGVGKQEYVMIGALVVIIVGSLVFTVIHITGDDTPGGGAQYEVKFKCEQCGHEFSPDPKQSDDYEMAMEMGGAIKCPECGGQALPMTRCPNCEKYYVSDLTRYQAQYYASDQPPPPGPEPKQICPHCGTDYREWWRKKREERRSD
jgi:DNA-directed RNA polymerase subunit RPC12/RpoP